MNDAPANPADGPLAIPDVPPRPPAERRYRFKRGARRATAVPRRAGIPRPYGWMFAGSILGLVAFFCLANPYQKDPETVALSALVLGLASLPMALFLFRGQTYQVPAFEAHCLFVAFCFGFAGFMPIPDTANQMLAVKAANLTVALRCSSLGVVTLLLGYYVVGNKLFRRVRSFSRQQTIHPRNLEWLAWSACLAGLVLGMLAPMVGLSALTQETDMLFDLGFFGLLVLAFGKKLGFLSRGLLWFGLIPYVVIYLSGINTGQLAGIVTLTCWIGLIFLRAKGQVPVPLYLGAFVLFVVLQPVKFHVRELTWNEGRTLGPVETFDAYRDGFYDYYGSARAFWLEKGNTFESSFNRLNHLSTFAAIIRDTPSREPFIYGASYYPLFVKLIPRAIWPNKPQEQFGNDWARRYGYLGESDFTTSFNLAWLPEMFMNFGWIGVMVIMCLVGILFRFLWKWLMEKPADTTHYIVAITLAQSLVFTESNMSMKLGGVFILLIFLWLLGQGLAFLGLYVHRPATTQRKGSASPAPSDRETALGNRA